MYLPRSAWASLLHSLLRAPETLAAPQMLFLESVPLFMLFLLAVPCSPAPLFPCSLAPLLATL